MFVCAWIHIVSNIITGAFNVETTHSSTSMFHHGSHGVSPTPAIYRTKITACGLTPGTKGRGGTPSRPRTQRVHVAKGNHTGCSSLCWERPCMLLLWVYVVSSSSDIGCAGLWSNLHFGPGYLPFVCIGSRCRPVRNERPGIIEKVTQPRTAMRGRWFTPFCAACHQSRLW